MSKAKKKPAKKKPAKNKATPKKKAAKKKTTPKPAKKKPAKKAAKKKATAKPAKKKPAKKKAAPKKKPAKKKAAPKKKSEKFDALEHLVSSEDKRLGAKIERFRKPVSIDKAYDFSQALFVRDLRMLDSLKHQIARRGEMMDKIKSFSDRVKKALGEQISIDIFLSAHDRVCMSASFKPNKGQHSLDGDPAVAAAFKTSGLFKLMSLNGTGAFSASKVRNHDFIEKKWEYVEPEAAASNIDEAH